MKTLRVILVTEVDIDYVSQSLNGFYYKVYNDGRFSKISSSSKIEEEIDDIEISDKEYNMVLSSDDENRILGQGLVFNKLKHLFTDNVKYITIYEKKN